MTIMVFGVFVDVPLIVGGFLVMLVYRKQLTKKVVKHFPARLPILGLYLVLSVPLIFFEEQINCMQSWCGRVLVPPTLGFITVEMLLLGLLSVRLHAKNALRVTLLFSIFGIFWELFLGGLVSAPFLVDLVLAPYVMVSYGFVSVLPLNLLLESRSDHVGTKLGQPIQVSSPTSPSPL